MGKVNIGLRGWRFDEEAVLDDDGRVRPIGTMERDTKARILRLTERVTDPCDVCWLQHGDENIEECNPAAAIYGEPGGEVVLCPVHEGDFVYWFRERADEDLIGTTELSDAFHEWFLEGGRAPEDYPGVEHVEEAPDEIPEAPDPYEELPGLESEIEDLDEEDLDALEMDLDDLDV